MPSSKQKWTIIGKTTGKTLGKGLEGETPDEALDALIQQIATAEDVPVETVRKRFAGDTYTIINDV